MPIEPTIVIAFLLDLSLGDPCRMHPVRVIGRAVNFAEAVIRRITTRLKIAGLVALALVVSTTGLCAWGLVEIPGIGWLVSLYLAYSGLALGQLFREGRKVSALIEQDRPDRARRALGMLVSRDVSDLDEPGLERTLAETISENVNDAFTAPLFYLAIFGVPGMWAYKAVSTMDSMWGYKNERYRDLGLASAKADDVLAFIPARLTALFMILAGALLGFNSRAARKNVFAQAGRTESPNAGWPMAAAAWLLDAAVGGPAVYFGKIKDKPVLGPEGKAWDTGKIARLLTLTLVTGFIAAGIMIFAGYFLRIRLIGA